MCSSPKAADAILEALAAGGSQVRPQRTAAPSAAATNRRENACVLKGQAGLHSPCVLKGQSGVLKGQSGRHSSCVTAAALQRRGWERSHVGQLCCAPPPLCCCCWRCRLSLSHVHAAARQTALKSEALPSFPFPAFQARAAVEALLTNACNNQTATDEALQAFLRSPEMSNSTTVLRWACGAADPACAATPRR